MPIENNINISTGGFSKCYPADIARLMMDHGINNIELSGGLHDPVLLKKLLDLKSEGALFQIHNYFPPPNNKFVINLASQNLTIYQQSSEHVKKAIDWCSILGIETYSFHAGFLIDPLVSQLGKAIDKTVLANRSLAKNLFIKRVSELNSYAEDKNVRLLVENNVLSEKNLINFSGNPLLMCDPLECLEIMSALPRGIGMLLDVAHLKVSANSLKFDPSEMFGIEDLKIRGYHLSDNNGFEDSNEMFDGASWFWDFINLKCRYISLEVYGASFDELKVMRDLAKEKFNIVNS